MVQFVNAGSYTLRCRRFLDDRLPYASRHQGSVTQAGTTVSGIATNFNQQMVGKSIVYLDDIVNPVLTEAKIVSVSSATKMQVDVSQSIAGANNTPVEYTINPGKNSTDYMNFLFPYDEHAPIKFPLSYNELHIELRSRPMAPGSPGALVESWTESIDHNDEEISITVNIQYPGKFNLSAVFNRSGFNTAPPGAPQTPLTPKPVPYLYIAYNDF